MQTAMTDQESPDRISYQCNVCAGINEFVEVTTLDRETGQCRHCHAQVRLRAIVHLISKAMFGQSMPVKYWPENTGIKGIGISDWAGYQPFFEQKIDYINGQYHEEPRIDVRSPPEHLIGTADFVSCSDVFEHVDPPIELAFTGIHSLLKPGGWLIFSVPYSFEETVEHFPDLYEWNIQNEANDYVLRNRTRDGHEQEFRNLIFHGGPGQVLEMRVFGYHDLIKLLQAVGFTDITPMGNDVFEFGIRQPHPWSRPIAARKI